MYSAGYDLAISMGRVQKGEFFRLVMLWLPALTKWLVGFQSEVVHFRVKHSPSRDTLLITFIATVVPRVWPHKPQYCLNWSITSYAPQFNLEAYAHPLQPTLHHLMHLIPSLSHRWNWYSSVWRRQWRGRGYFGVKLMEHRIGQSDLFEDLKGGKPYWGKYLLIVGQGAEGVG